MTVKFGLQEKERETIYNVFKMFPHVQSVIIFGSRAMGNFKQGSDVDLALIGTIDSTTLARLKYHLNEETTLPYFFDIVIYDNVSNPEFKSHIDTHGKLFYKLV